MPANARQPAEGITIDGTDEDFGNGFDDDPAPPPPKPVRGTVTLKNDDWRSVMVNVGTRDGVRRESDFRFAGSDNAGRARPPANPFVGSAGNRSLPPEVNRLFAMGEPAGHSGSDNAETVLFPADLFIDRFWSQSLPPELYRKIAVGATVESADDLSPDARQAVRKSGGMLIAEIAEQEAIREGGGWRGYAPDEMKSRALQTIIDRLGPDGIDRSGSPLLIATTGGSFGSLVTHFDQGTRMLLEAGANPNIADNTGNTPLVSSILTRRPAAARLLLEAGAVPNQRGAGGVTPLMAAASVDDVATARLLLEHDDDLETRSDDGATALVHAARRSQAKMVLFLLSAGADPDAVDARGEGALFHLAHASAEPRILDAISAIVEAGGTVDIRNRDGSTPLMQAQSEAVARRLLESGADAGAKDRFGRNVLFTLRIFGPDDVRFLRELCDAGADADAIDLRDGTTPLARAIDDGSPEAVAVLLEKGADPRRSDMKEGRTALSRAIDRNDIESVRLFLARKVDPNAPDRDGKPPIMRALEAGTRGHDDRRLPIFRALLAAGADPNAFAANLTALMAATWPWPLDFVDALLDAGANVDARLENGWTASASAAQSGNLAVLERILARKPRLDGLEGRRALSAALSHPRVLRALLAYGVAANSVDESFEPILCEAARTGESGAVRELLAAGADPVARRPDGMTPLSLAGGSRREEIRKMLLEAGAGKTP
jgi:ankyrin repeat protein